MGFANDLVMRYADRARCILRLTPYCCKDCVVRVIDWSFFKCDETWGVMADEWQVWELLKRPSLMRALLSRGVRRIVLYACFNEDLIKRLQRLGFRPINYACSSECPVTEEIVVPPNAYLIERFVLGGSTVYVHLFKPRVKNPESALTSTLRYLDEKGLLPSIGLILDGFEF